MLSAAILIVMGPTIGRLPIAPPTLVGFTFVFLLGLAVFLPLFVWDRKTLGHDAPGYEAWLRDGRHCGRDSADRVLGAIAVGKVCGAAPGSWRLGRFRFRHRCDQLQRLVR